ncbi:MAG: N-acetylmuramoyl-L-alanine amidase, partial [Acidimicrobiia bacterium]
MTRPVLAAAVIASLLLGVPPAPATASNEAVGRNSVGVVDQGGGWKLTDPVTGGRPDFTYGDPADIPFAGDWDCDGIATPGRRSTGQVFLGNSNSAGVADATFVFGNRGDYPLTGDFDGDGCDSLSVYRPSEAGLYIINRMGADGGGLGPAEMHYVYGDPGDVPFAGDWDGDGIDTVGLYRPATATVYLRDSNSTGVADLIVRSGMGVPVAGDFGILPDPPSGPAVTLSMVSREAWGARPAETWRMLHHTISRLTVHHAGTQPSGSGPPRYRGWQSDHMDGQGWPDLAYHVIIGVDGTIYEGRDPADRGDSATSYDTDRHFQVVVDGNFEVDLPTPAQLDSLAAVLAWAAEHYGVSPATISGHRDHAATLCPGGHLQDMIASGELRAAVEALIADRRGRARWALTPPPP